MTDDEQFKKLKEMLINMVNTDIEPGRAEKSIVAACMLSEGMDMTFEVFNDPKEALEAIFSCCEKVSKRYGIEFHVANLHGAKVH